MSERHKCQWCRCLIRCEQPKAIKEHCTYCGWNLADLKPPPVSMREWIRRHALLLLMIPGLFALTILANLLHIDTDETR